MSSEDGTNALEEFKTTLDGLTFNSRPIITTLTQLAEEHMSLAQEFVGLIENRLEKCVPSQKLFTFYVMDSICKNAGSPYTIYFSKNLHKLFRKTYLLVDNQTRTKMISMFKTWMVPLPAGDLMFDHSSLNSIENFLIKASALHQKSATPPAMQQHTAHNGPAGSNISVKSLLSDIDKLALITQSKLVSTPDDAKLQAKVAILKQLRQELQKERLAPEFLSQVHQQLKQIFAQEHQQQQQQQQLPLQNSSQFLPPSSQGSVNNDMSRGSPQANGNNGSMFGGSLQFNAPFLNQLTNSNRLNKLSSLVNMLREKELLHEPGESSITTLAAKLEPEFDSSKTAQLPSYSLLQDILGDLEAQRQTQNLDILNASVLQLSQQFVLNDNHPITEKLVHFLYRAKPNKCSICGKRFGNTLEEKELEIQHLDWHFRVNKKIKGIQSNTTTSTKVIQSRNWYLDENQWADFKEEDIIATDIDAGAAEQQPTFADNREDSTDAIYTKLRNKYIVVPDYATDMKFQCPICTESTYGKYDEDLGEWIWSNCVQVGDKFFHATCYYEAAKSQQSNTSSSPSFQNLQLDLGIFNELLQ
ncbi:Pcf11 [Kluyveromyces lactis]|nr:Pcf11 [Kluyveromyces lactis]